VFASFQYEIMKNMHCPSTFFFSLRFSACFFFFSSSVTSSLANCSRSSIAQ
jgi:hypothetical protein